MLFATAVGRDYIWRRALLPELVDEGFRHVVPLALLLKAGLLHADVLAADLGKEREEEHVLFFALCLAAEQGRVVVRTHVDADFAHAVDQPALALLRTKLIAHLLQIHEIHRVRKRDVLELHLWNGTARASSGMERMGISASKSRLVFEAEI